MTSRCQNRCAWPSPKRWFSWAPRSRRKAERSIALFQQVLAAEPDFAAAWAGLAEAQFLAGDRTAARVAAHTALGEDPSSARAHHVQGFIYLVEDWEFAAAERSLAEAIRLAPERLRYRASLALCLIAQGKMDAAALQLDEIWGQEGLRFALGSDAGWMEYLVGRYGRSFRLCAAVAELTEPRGWGENCAIASLVRLGRLEEAVDRAEAVSRIERDRRSAVVAGQLSAVEAASVLGVARSRPGGGGICVALRARSPLCRARTNRRRVGCTRDIRRGEIHDVRHRFAGSGLRSSPCSRQVSGAHAARLALNPLATLQLCPSSQLVQTEFTSNSRFTHGPCRDPVEALCQRSTASHSAPESHQRVNSQIEKAMNSKPKSSRRLILCVLASALCVGLWFALPAAAVDPDRVLLRCTLDVIDAGSHGAPDTTECVKTALRSSHPEFDPLTATLHGDPQPVSGRYPELAVGQGPGLRWTRRLSDSHEYADSRWSELFHRRGLGLGCLPFGQCLSNPTARDARYQQVSGAGHRRRRRVEDPLHCGAECADLDLVPPRGSIRSTRAEDLCRRTTVGHRHRRLRIVDDLGVGLRYLGDRRAGLVRWSGSGVRGSYRRGRGVCRSPCLRARSIATRWIARPRRSRS